MQHFSRVARIVNYAMENCIRSRRQRGRPRSTGDSEENHHFIWHLGPSCVAKRSREHFKSEQGVHFTPTLERNAPWSRRTVSLRSRRQRERPRSTGDSVKKITTLFGTSVPPALPNAMENCARCDWGLTTLSGEVNVRFIVLLSLFGRSQGRVCGGKAGPLT